MKTGSINKVGPTGDLFICFAIDAMIDKATWISGVTFQYGTF